MNAGAPLAPLPSWASVCGATKPDAVVGQPGATWAGAIAAKLADTRFTGAEFGISVWVEGLGEIVSRAPDRLLMPASNQKLWTAAGIHLSLPPDFTFRTQLMTTGTLLGGVLSGDLYVIGGGDPTLTTTGSHSLDSLATEIKRRGIDRIAGRVVIDESRYDVTRTPSGWEPWQLDYVGPLSAFMVDWNNVRKEVEFMNDPTRANAQRFVERLEKADVEVAGEVAVATVAADASPLFAVDSWALPKLLNHMLSESDNMMAESFVREIGRRRRGIASTPAGLAAIDEVITQSMCLSKEGINDDGSGVSRYSTHSARYWRHLLEAIRAQPWGAQFESQLAISGKTGTLASRLNTPALTGRVRAKTGTVRGARALSGYGTTLGGRAVVFSIIGNGDDTKLTTKVIDELVETIVSYDG
ncbi:MAG TPA: D-alanyl-D-alanine carboxypeptidase/D-alanyl-D-alanine-endopeptidase [Acidimicrobiales bacterium]|nr:D-alanyl-D-alanine carboxypeptidase/D-alanyl-D-alanine-endopeptidase [Acidimicrobiales bacterium]